ncbi:MAG: DUF3617 family protein [Bdellovibrio sp.]|nr:DUF3617 family protein [Bdellovibrio sp.]
MKYLIIVLFPLSALTQTLNSGMWHSEAYFKLNGIPMPPKKDDSCVTESEAKNPKIAIEDSLKRNDCQLTNWVLKKNNVKATVKCKNDQYEADGELKGTFEKRSYQLEGRIKGHHQLIGHAYADVDFKGTWTGFCTKKN